MDRDQQPRPGWNNASRRRTMASPVLAFTLGVVAIGLVAAIILIPGFLPLGRPGSSCEAGCATQPTQTASGGSPTPAPTESASPTPSPTFVRPTPTPLPTFTSYTVAPGDSLNTIAHRFQTTARSLAWWNRGTYPTLDPESAAYAPGHIEVGWVLTLLPGTVVDDANPPTPSPGPPTPVPTATDAGQSPGPTSS
jgi:hypothetical protein